MSRTLDDQETLACAIRVLWALVERAGGKITISGEEASPVIGPVHVHVDDDGAITVAVGEKIVHQ